jgi:hypothetical protein
MAVTYEKSSDGNLKEIDTKVVAKKYSLKQLRKEKQLLKAELDAINALIDQAVLLGAKEEE